MFDGPCSRQVPERVQQACCLPVMFEADGTSYHDRIEAKGRPLPSFVEPSDHSCQFCGVPVDHGICIRHSVAHNPSVQNIRFARPVSRECFSPKTHSLPYSRTTCALWIDNAVGVTWRWASRKFVYPIARVATVTTLAKATIITYRDVAPRPRRELLCRSVNTPDM